MLFNLIVQIHHMQNVQKLALVLMETFYLHIKNGTGIYLNAVMLADILCQTQFILVFNIHKFLLRFLIVCIDRQFFQMGQVGYPVVSNIFIHPFCQQRIAVV
ncbi:hypothetical protein IMSAGC013_01187 [Lachnospiraceae bacterium]|nr:hypothetical protein IMSAGC013_01187 [Lachnospiraceae bacterium]